jgi:hypothetical protein
VPPYRPAFNNGSVAAFSSDTPVRGGNVTIRPVAPKLSIRRDGTGSG